MKAKTDLTNVWHESKGKLSSLDDLERSQRSVGHHRPRQLHTSISQGPGKNQPFFIFPTYPSDVRQFSA